MTAPRHQHQRRVDAKFVLPSVAVGSDDHSACTLKRERTQARMRAGVIILVMLAKEDVIAHRLMLSSSSLHRSAASDFGVQSSMRSLKFLDRDRPHQPGRHRRLQRLSTETAEVASQSYACWRCLHNESPNCQRIPIVNGRPEQPMFISTGVVPGSNCRLLQITAQTGKRMPQHQTRLPRQARPSPRCSISLLASSSGSDSELSERVFSWVDGAVVGHNLCPFAAAVREHIRVSVCHAAPGDQAKALVAEELRLLLALPSNRPATTLVLMAHPAFAHSFDALMEFLPDAQDAADEMTQLQGAPAVQVLPFHPAASYSDVANDPADLATRSPVALLHLLRDSDVTAADDAWERLHAPNTPPSVQQRNAAYLRGIGWDALSRQWDAW